MNDRLDPNVCTYFDAKVACSVCNARPSMRKTGKCAPHSVIPYDASREDDWIDCYEGCLKHDKVAHRKYIDKTKPSSIAKQKKPLVPTPLPNLNAVSRIHKHPADKRQANLARVLKDALKSRGISQERVSEAINIPYRTLNSYLCGEYPFPFFVVCAVLDYLYEHDHTIKMAKGRR